jgi:hypothetical protein
MQVHVENRLLRDLTSGRNQVHPRRIQRPVDGQANGVGRTRKLGR